MLKYHTDIFSQLKLWTTASNVAKNAFLQIPKAQPITIPHEKEAKNSL